MLHHKDELILQQFQAKSGSQNYQSLKVELMQLVLNHAITMAVNWRKIGGGFS